MVNFIRKNIKTISKYNLIFIVVAWLIYVNIYVVNYLEEWINESE